ncbi:hypothetical protein F4819DRAFT_138506 [Hypoxylon fuscum]|nr:hypothetical protein F4819DRAFT_138506 [Hypoxylon fuscum]
MMFVTAIVAFVAAFAQLASAHFKIMYPQERADILGSTNNTVSEWVYPCGGVPDDFGNRTDWPLTGGALQVRLHHPWTYFYVNVGLQLDPNVNSNVTDFDMTLTPGVVNVTGSGIFCLPSLKMPANMTDGAKGAIQVVTNNNDGAALYSCADITFRANAKTPDGMCKNDTQMSAVVIGDPMSMSMPMPMSNQTVTVTASAPTASQTGTSSSSGATTAFLVGGAKLATMVGLVGILSAAMMLYI